jgi:hypothetical protein
MKPAISKNKTAGCHAAFPASRTNLEKMIWHLQIFNPLSARKEINRQE